MRRLVTCAVLGVLVVVAHVSGQQPAFAPVSAQSFGAAGLAADLILSNGKIVTVDERFTIAQAVAVRGGRIIAVGTNQDIARLGGPATQRIDLRGRTVIPYFVFREDDLGSIQPGKAADMVVLDRDYLDVPADEIKDIKPVQTFVGGRMVYNAEPVGGSR